MDVSTWRDAGNAEDEKKNAKRCLSIRILRRTRIAPSIARKAIARIQCQASISKFFNIRDRDKIDAVAKSNDLLMN